MHGVTGSDPPVSQVTLEVFVGATLGTAGTPVFTQPGHILSIWNTAADGSGTDFDPTTEAILGDMILYAQWVSQVTVRLEVVDGRTPNVGVGAPVTTLDVPGGTPSPLITVNGVGNGERIIPAADLPSTPVISLTGINPNWFTVTLTRYDGTTPTPIPGAFNNDNLGTAAVWAPTTPSQLAITTSGQNVTFRVSISANPGPMMTINTPIISYGAHTINATGPETITLAGAHTAQPSVATNPASIVFNVFHDGTGGAGWTLDVSSQAPAGGPSAGCSILASRMWSERTGVNWWIYHDGGAGSSARVTTSERINGLGPGPLISNFTWANPEFDGVAVRTEANLPPLAGSHQAYMIWTLIAGG